MKKNLFWKIEKLKLLEQIRNNFVIIENYDAVKE